MLEKQTFLNKDLVLRVSPSYDPRKFEPNKYEAFLDALCGNREYQKEAIRITLRYFLGGEYQSLRELAEENYHSNPKLQEKYSSFEDFSRVLQLPDQLSGSLDHATATGKSYVMYGIARIMLAEGAVDQVLVLCPSNTIEAGLKEKFLSLSADKTLKDLLPSDSIVANPRIINASNTIQRGDICIENIHATYINTKSAIEDSLVGKGERTLVLNDEAHHLMNPSDTALKKWKEFLLDSKYGFKFIVNVSGTCYIGSEYFTDVIHRFSLKNSIEEKFVKSIRYVAEDSSGSEDEKFQKIYENHIENKTVKYREVKPLTILVTKDIAACKRLTEKLTTFLAEKENISKEQAAEKVLIVTSANEHKNNIPILRRVDDRDNPIEWITSVSMLSEGWDVKNVFQIVPHEERAFNSKLLIAQVLGRGLRIPPVYKGEQPIVTVFNHDKWSSNIKHLVDEVLEIEKRLYSYPVEKKGDYNFDLYNINYKRTEEKVEYPQENPYELLKKEYIAYSSQAEVVPEDTVYVTAINRARETVTYSITHKLYSVEEIAQDVFNRLLIFDQEAETEYSQKFTKQKIAKIIRKSLAEIQDESGKVNETNRIATLKAFGVIKRKGTKSLRFKIEAQKLLKISTKEIRKNSLGVGSLRHDSTVFWDDYSITLGESADIKLLKEIEEDESLPRSAIIKVENKYNFKTPLNVAFASHEPERRFIRGLTSDKVSRTINAWIKSLDVGFYSIDYSWRKGEHPKQGSFNPDFFIKIGQDILVIEIKSDDDISDENRAKLRYAREHFARVNDLQKEQRYYFKFLSPASFELFFQMLSNGTYQDFKSELEAKLENRD
ncbi:MAG TPA: DEAD/DEAH box helicase family protein [Candidatus Marinimicrobia bacterium]|nr:DEAD/DEAH box helicase family protein [Acetomicrobium sp.]HOU17948.1 DEAD/DEAH box helicase family protein [Candidatus Neomarinimicrobiota bacterium]HQE95628.1 DEAD/DEAH box helicase family protein [Candidatus Neomarinimicrobiota bacterium]HQH56501.1 DEAD/DEAH box helicase family protein [Candidatus Neomarinimicrobiota bacterium]